MWEYNGGRAGIAPQSVVAFSVCLLLLLFDDVFGFVFVVVVSCMCFLKFFF